MARRGATFLTTSGSGGRESDVRDVADTFRRMDGDGRPGQLGIVPIVRYLNPRLGGVSGVAVLGCISWTDAGSANPDPDRRRVPARLGVPAGRRGGITLRRPPSVRREGRNQFWLTRGRVQVERGVGAPAM